MVHGKCKSAGCYAMTDALIEEIYALARESFIGGQENFHVHAFPFRMTVANLERHKASPHAKFWQTLKEGYDHFEASRLVPEVAVCERRYVVNVKLDGRQPRQSGRRLPDVRAAESGAVHAARRRAVRRARRRQRPADAHRCRQAGQRSRRAGADVRVGRAGFAVEAAGGNRRR